MSQVQAPLFHHVCIIGIGLIGSSLARALRKYGLAHKIMICDASEYNLNQAKKLYLGDEYTLSAVEAVKGCDLVVLATPVGTFGAIAQDIAPHLIKDAILTDVGSVKTVMEKEVKPHLKADTIMIGGHPVAGTEYSGPKAGFAELFEERWCILCPDDNAPNEAIEKLRQLWSAVKSQVSIMPAARHDEVLAITSHLPHLIAWTIVGTAADMEERTKGDVIRFSASGFRDFTRIAASDPIMWRDVFLNNKTAVLETLGRFSEDLTMLQRAIRDEDGAALEKHFSRGRDIRKRIIDAGQS